MNRLTDRLLLPIVLLSLSLCACREDDVIFIPETVPTGQPELTETSGFYLLNEGNMGSNKCTLDYYDLASATYFRNIYASANPTVPKELGDVGNDLKIYGAKLWAVINCSGKVEVMRTADATRLGQVDIPNCRNIAFHGAYAYVTSYAGPVEVRPDYSQLGYVAKVDTATLQVVDRCVVGYQPDGIVACGDKLYVANSGGYRVPNYEKTLSVIDIASMQVCDEIELVENLDKIVADNHGRLWISARGDYYDTAASLLCYDTRKNRIEGAWSLAVSDMWLHAGMLYVVGTAWSETAGYAAPFYRTIDTDALQLIEGQFITDGTETQIRRPYGVAVDPASGSVYVTDARTYLNPGYLHCYSPEGKHLWQVRTGDIPSCIAFVGC